MKFLNYALAVILGAALGSLVTCRLFNRTAADEVAPTPGFRRAAQTASAAFNATVKRMALEDEMLRAQLAGARASLAAHEATLRQTKDQLDELRRPMTADIMSSALRAELKSGEVVVTGGYKLPNGKRLYAFAQPVIQRVDGKEVVKIESRFLSISDEAGTAVGLGTIATNAANTLQHGEVWVADEQTAVLAKLNALPGTELMTTPGITVNPGSSGAIELGDMKLKVTPVISADHANMDFEVRLEQPAQQPAQAPALKP